MAKLEVISEKFAVWKMCRYVMFLTIIKW